MVVGALGAGVRRWPDGLRPATRAVWLARVGADDDAMTEFDERFPTHAGAVLPGRPLPVIVELVGQSPQQVGDSPPVHAVLQTSPEVDPLISKIGHS